MNDLVVLLAVVAVGLVVHFLSRDRRDCRLCEHSTHPKLVRIGYKQHILQVGRECEYEGPLKDFKPCQRYERDWRRLRP